MSDTCLNYKSKNCVFCYFKTFYHSLDSDLIQHLQFERFPFNES